ncbi:MAG: OstA-like protein, partial [Saprospiraceae bacterium]
MDSILCGCSIDLRVAIVVACMLVSSITFGQVKSTVKDTSDKDVILIDHFGKLIEDREGIESVKWISKELQLRVDSTFIYADSAVIYADTRVFAYNDVVIQQGDSLRVFTDSLFYSRDTDIADLNGEVVLEQGTKQLWTNGLTYNLGKRYGEYHQGGTLIDRGLQVTSNSGIYYAGSKEVLFKDDVVVLHPKFSMAADSLRYLAGQSLVLFTGPTNIYTPNAKIYCEGGFYDLETEVAEFNKNAQYAGGNKTATADTIRYDSKAAEVTMSGN